MFGSKQELLHVAKTKNYTAGHLEKVGRLLQVLKSISDIPYLKNRLILKGGTALNLFYHTSVPRLSVDIDFNYVGHLNVEQMQADRKTINETLRKIMQQSDFQVGKNRHSRHALDMSVWRYPSLLGQYGNLKIDISYMYRVPLWNIEDKSHHLPLFNSVTVPILNLHELMAGKLCALFERTASRDLFDMHYFFRNVLYNTETLKLASTLYLSMCNVQVSRFQLSQFNYDVKDVKRNLLPVLKQSALPRTPKQINLWTQTRVDELQEEMKVVFPLEQQQVNFIENVRAGKIEPDLITNNKDLQARIAQHPAILWQAKKARVSSA